MPLANLIIRNRIGILITILLVAILASLGLSRFELNENMSDFFVEGDNTLVNQAHYEELFGKQDGMAVLFESEDVFSLESLEQIYKVQQYIKEQVPYAKEVVSQVALYQKPTYTFDKDGKLLGSSAEIDSVTQLLYKDHALKDVLFSTDKSESLITCGFAYPDSLSSLSAFERGEITSDAMDGITLPDGMRITIVAESVVAFRKKKEMFEDLSFVLIFGSVVAVILCLFLFNNTQAFIGSLLLIGLVPAIVFGVMGWLGISMSSSFISVPILLTMGVAIGNAVHLNHFFKIGLRTKRPNKIVAAAYAIHASWRPILFAAMTTIAALCSFLFVEVKPIRLVGLSSAACILVLYFLCMLLFPIVLTLGKRRKISSSRPSYMPFTFDHFAPFIKKQGKYIILFFLLISVLAAIATTQLKINFSVFEMMGVKLPHMQDQLRIKDSQLCSNEFVNLSILTSKNEFLSPEELTNLTLLQEEINHLPLVKRTSSVADFSKQLNRMNHGDDSAYARIPARKSTVYKHFSQMKTVAPGFLEQWLTPDYADARILIEMTDFSSSTITENMEEIEVLVQYYFPTNKASFFSGSAYQMARMNQHITHGLVVSVVVALLLITILMMFSFRSIKLGLIAMFPNVFPVLICGAIVAIFEIPLEFVTMTVAPLILGLAVDDTIHFISSLKKNILSLQDYDKGIMASYKEVGSSIAKTTIILSFTFMVFTISDVNSTQNMGLLSCAGIISAYLADIFTMPILIRWFKPFKLEIKE